LPAFAGAIDPALFNFLSYAMLTERKIAGFVDADYFPCLKMVRMHGSPVEGEDVILRGLHSCFDGMT